MDLFVTLATRLTEVVPPKSSAASDLRCGCCRWRLHRLRVKCWSYRWCITAVTSFASYATAKNSSVRGVVCQRRFNSRKRGTYTCTIVCWQQLEVALYVGELTAIADRPVPVSPTNYTATQVGSRLVFHIDFRILLDYDASTNTPTAAPCLDFCLYSLSVPHHANLTLKL